MSCPALGCQHHHEHLFNICSTGCGFTASVKRTGQHRLDWIIHFLLPFLENLFIWHFTAITERNGCFSGMHTQALVASVVTEKMKSGNTDLLAFIAATKCSFWMRMQAEYPIRLKESSLFTWTAPTGATHLVTVHTGATQLNESTAMAWPGAVYHIVICPRISLREADSCRLECEPWVTQPARRKGLSLYENH